MLKLTHTRLLFMETFIFMLFVVILLFSSLSGSSIYAGCCVYFAPIMACLLWCWTSTKSDEGLFNKLFMCVTGRWIIHKINIAAAEQWNFVLTSAGMF